MSKCRSFCVQAYLTSTYFQQRLTYAACASGSQQQSVKELSLLATTLIINRRQKQSLFFLLLLSAVSSPDSLSSYFGSALHASWREVKDRFLSAVPPVHLHGKNTFQEKKKARSKHLWRQLKYWGTFKDSECGVSKRLVTVPVFFPVQMQEDVHLQISLSFSSSLNERADVYIFEMEFLNYIQIFQ